MFSSTDYTYILCGGGGAIAIQKFIEQKFGISILERVFDPDINKIDRVDDRGIIGDILASSRYYRRSRSLMYEDDFGKYFQKINIRLNKAQVLQYFPSFAKYKGKKLADMVSISGSNSIEIPHKVCFTVFLQILNEMSKLLSTPAFPIFNTSLLPLERKTSSITIDKLENTVIDNLYEFMSHKALLDIDICHKNFEDFYSSTKYRIVFTPINVRPNILKRNIEFDDIEQLKNYHFLKELYDNITYSREYEVATNKKEFIIDLLKSINIESYNSNGEATTEGSLFEYIQTEVADNGIAYFLIDSCWYEIKSQFDKLLTEKYQARISSNVSNFSFIPSWPIGLDENGYNKLFDSKSNPLYLHKVLIDNVEICDAIFIENNITYVISVKDGINAEIRDLTSQAFMSCRIIEEERRTKQKNNITKLYFSAQKNNRISNSISEKDFIDYFIKNEIHYCLVVRPGKYTENDIKLGNYESRIARFSLYEFSSFIYSNELKFSLIVR